MRGEDLNLRPLGYAYHSSFRWPVCAGCGLDFLFTLGPTMSPLGCLPLSLYTFPSCLRPHEGLGSGLPRHWLPRV